MRVRARNIIRFFVQIKVTHVFALCVIAEFLLDQLGHDKFSEIRELDMSGQSLRKIEEGLIVNSRFDNIVELNLDHNCLTSLEV